MREVTSQLAFNLGELSEDAWSRADLVQYSRGCRLGLNLQARVAGPAGRRRGTWYAGAPKFSDKAVRLVPFRRNSEDALMLEFGDLYCRVWTVNWTPLMNGGSQVEFVTPWTAAQLAGLQWSQAGDLIYFCHRDGLRPHTLRRTSNTAWTIAPTQYLNGPWMAENTDPAKTVTVAKPVGTGVAITTNFAFFTPQHVGTLLRVRESTGNPSVDSWAPSTAFQSKWCALSDGRVYRNADGVTKTSGSTPPLHERGVQRDGSMSWEYLHDGAGIVRIDAVSDATHAACTVLAMVPAYTVDNNKAAYYEGPGPVPIPSVPGPTYCWSEGAWSDLRGWPRVVPAFREERLVTGGTTSEPDMVDMTRTAGYSPEKLDFTPGRGTGRVVDDDAVRKPVGDSRDRLVWLMSAGSLLAGTAAGEYVISGATLDDPIAPSSCVARGVGGFGSADVTPVLAHDAVLFVAAGGETLRELRVQPDDSVVPRDLSVAAEHLSGRGVVELAWVKQPDNVLWMRLADGGLAAMTYHLEQNVIGWHTQSLGGGFVAESLAVLPGPKGRERLWIAARRTKDSVVQRAILVMSVPDEALFYDAAEKYVGAKTGAVSGLDHLAGELVSALADGAEHRQVAVSGAGGLTLPNDDQAASIVAGLPYLSRWEGLPPEFGAPGASTGKRVRFTHALAILTAADCRIGTTDDLEGDGAAERLLNRKEADLAGPVPRRLVQRVPLGGGTGRERRIYIETDAGWDMVVRAIRPEADVNG